MPQDGLDFPEDPREQRRRRMYGLLASLRLTLLDKPERMAKELDLIAAEFDACVMDALKKWGVR